MDGEDLTLVLEDRIGRSDALDRKLAEAEAHGRPYVRLRDVL
jgi:hypothetical protein